MQSTTAIVWTALVLSCINCMLPCCQGLPLGRAPSWALRLDTSKGNEPFVAAIGAQVVRAPLKYIGPYPCLSLRFPHLNTTAQRAKNVTGVSLDFVLDTASNINIINAAVAAELQLPIVGRAMPGVSAAGALPGGETYLLDEAELEGLYEPFTFIRGLTASALPVASPAAAGILGLSFFQTFRGGVEFRWGDAEYKQGTRTPHVTPHVTFFGERVENVERGRRSVRIQRIPATQLPSVTLRTSGVDINALLDTGSPITVLNAQAAQIARIETVPVPSAKTHTPWDAFTSYYQRAQATASGDLLTVQGADGKPVQLLRSQRKVKIDLCSFKGDKNMVDLGWSYVYVGDLPGLAALGALGVDSPPAIVLGVDVLRNRKSMLLDAQENIILFE